MLIRVAEQPGGDAAQQAAVQKVRGALGDAVEYRRVEVVGPRVSGELLAYGMLGLMLAIFAILIYLWFRFEWQFALGAMIANVHDIVLTIGFMSISQVDFDLTSIAALLTILGYSLNDTVVIYDRIREMLRRYKKMPMPELLNEFDQLDAVALDHHPRHGDAGVAGAVVVRRYSHPQLHRGHDVRRGAGRHLHLDLHRGTDPDLSRRRHPPGRRAGKAVEEMSHGEPLGRSASSEIGADRGLRQWRVRVCRDVASGLAAVPARMRSGPGRSRDAEDIDKHSLERVFAAADGIDTLIIGTGTDVWLPPSDLRERLRAVSVGAGCDADRSGDPHLQHHDRRAAARRGGADRGAMSSADGDSQAAEFCADLVRSHDFARYASTLVRAGRSSVARCLALYAFNVEISRVREQVSQPLPGEIRLQWWTDMLAGTGHGGVEGNPVAAELLLAIRQLAVCRSSGCRG